MSDKENIQLFFDLVDRRYNKESYFNIVRTSNMHPSNWRSNLNGDDSLLCALTVSSTMPQFLRNLLEQQVGNYSATYRMSKGAGRLGLTQFLSKRHRSFPCGSPTLKRNLALINARFRKFFTFIQHRNYGTSNLTHIALNLTIHFSSSPSF